MVEKESENIVTNQASQVRKHYYLDQHVVIAPKRSERPRQAKNQHTNEKQAQRRSIADETGIYETPGNNGESWSVKVIDNKYPAFTPENEDARGKQEIVLETPKEQVPFHELSVEEIEGVLKTYQHRVHELYEGYRYISVFKNQGSLAGASLAHAHSQIIATDITPANAKLDRIALTDYQRMHGTSAPCDIIRWELSKKKRVVAHTRYTTTISPYASQYPFESWIIPHRQCNSIVDLTEAEIHSLADHLKGVTVALGENDINFNYHLQERVAGLYNHFYIKVIPRINVQSGFELNTGIYINTVTPEYAASWYKKYVKVPSAV